MVILIMFGALETDPESLKKSLRGLKIRGRIFTPMFQEKKEVEGFSSLGSA